ncbi:hypothetical protein ADS79_12220 [Brevibacillus reuszeri]|uniref:Uncharacterized protein n=1 Tax=Brevibacillus reuszeri TaxID=54915 RepID=A0A0K9YVB0_9BACL|nr:hypothetical protein ADS79_12220 [Brevibacillus reuszeri]
MMITTLIVDKKVEKRTNNLIISFAVPRLFKKGFQSVEHGWVIFGQSGWVAPEKHCQEGVGG